MSSREAGYGSELLTFSLQLRRHPACEEVGVRPHQIDCVLCVVERTTNMVSEDGAVPAGGSSHKLCDFLSKAVVSR